MYKIFFFLLFFVGCGYEVTQQENDEKLYQCEKNYDSVVPKDVNNIINCSGYGDYVKDNVDSIVFYENKEQCYWLGGAEEPLGCTRNSDTCRNIYILKGNENIIPTNFMIATFIIHETTHIMGFGDKEAYNTANKLFYKNYIENNCYIFDNN